MMHTKGDNSMIIGITGTTGSGKSYVSSLFKEYGFKIIDMDEIAHNIYKKGGKCLEEIREYFGDKVFDNEGMLIRKALGEIVFSDEKKLATLNIITHKYIMEEAEKEMTGDKICLDIPLLFGTSYEKICEVKIGVICENDIRIKRIMERDNISYQYAMKRINSQLSNEYIASKCDYVIENNGNEKNVKERVKEIILNIT